MSSYEETYLKERSPETASNKKKKIQSKQKHYVQGRD